MQRKLLNAKLLKRKISINTKQEGDYRVTRRLYQTKDQKKMKILKRVTNEKIQETWQRKIYTKLELKMAENDRWIMEKIS